MNNFHIKILSAISLYLFVAIAYAGTYSGVYNGTFKDQFRINVGEFSLMVDANDIAVMVAFNVHAPDSGGLVKPGIQIKSNGSFSFTSDAGTVVGGKIISGVSVSGTFDAGGGSGTLFGSVRAYTGLFSSNGGYYKGLSRTIPEQCSGENSTTILHAIIAADGYSFYYAVYHANQDDEEEDGFLVINNPDGSFAGTTILGTAFNGVLSGTTITGASVNLGNCHSNFSLSRVVPLPPPPSTLDTDPVISVIIQFLLE